MYSRVLRLAAEPPFRLLARPILRRMPGDLRTRMAWACSRRPAYLLGLGNAALRCSRQGVSRICAIEFGVAGGTGLRILEAEAEAISRQTGVTIDVIGFDSGAGLPETTGDYRDHPDLWRPGDYPMDLV